MEPQYSYTTNNSVSSSSSSQYSSSTQLSYQHHHHHHHPDQEIINEPIRNSHSQILRKIPHKIIKKKPIAPMIPTPPKVYNVDSKDFRDVVQKLTGASDYRAMRLREVAPPPLSLSPAVAFDQNGGFGSTVLSPLGLGLSPASIEWCTSFLLSPPVHVGSVESSAVLN